MFQTHIKWGAECQSYEVAINLSARGETDPTVIAKVNWRDVPAFLQTFGQRYHFHFIVI